MGSLRLACGCWDEMGAWAGRVVLAVRLWANFGEGRHLVVKRREGMGLGMMRVLSDGGKALILGRG